MVMMYVGAETPHLLKSCLASAFHTINNNIPQTIQHPTSVRQYHRDDRYVAFDTAMCSQYKFRLE